MAASGDVLFQLGQNDGTDSDIWDDTALIIAYDKAIKSVKAGINGEQVGEQEGEVPEGSNSETTSKKPARRGKQKRKKRKSSNRQKWKVGDRCAAIFSEDGLLYDAIIKSVHYRQGTCWITYTSYGNEEEKDLDELMPPGQSDVMSQDEEANYSENGYDSIEANGFGNPRHPRSREYSPIGGNYYAPPTPPWQSFGHPWPSFPPPPRGPFDHLAPPPGPYHMRGPKSIPHPPPLAGGESEQEALYAMLMSWYMSGYHTGYFQGQKSARKRHGSKPSAER